MSQPSRPIGLSLHPPTGGSTSRVGTGPELDADGRTLDVGPTIRHTDRKQRRALRAMYRTCAFHDCDVAFDRCERCEIHRIRPRELGGPTDLPDLLPLCSRHHVVHEGGWQLELGDDRTLLILQPDGREFVRCRPDITEQRRPRHRRRRPAA